MLKWLYGFVLGNDDHIEGGRRPQQNPAMDDDTGGGGILTNPPDFCRRVLFFTALSWCPPSVTFLLIYYYGTKPVSSSNGQARSPLTLEVYCFHQDNCKDVRHNLGGVLLTFSLIEEKSVKEEKAVVFSSCSTAKICRADFPGIGEDMVDFRWSPRPRSRPQVLSDAFAGQCKQLDR